MIEGKNAFRKALTDQQWAELGAAVRAIHDTTPPPSVSDTVRRETFAGA